MANVLFKRGSYKNLPAAGSAVNGAIYMTEDEGGIYLGLSNGNLKRMGDYVFVDSLDKLYEYDFTSITKYTMFYVVQENILAFYDPDQIDPETGKQGKIIQINKQNSIKDLLGTPALDVDASGNITLVLKDKDLIPIPDATDTLKVQGGGSVTVTGNGSDTLKISGDNTVSTLSVDNSGNVQLKNSVNGAAASLAGSIAVKGSGQLAPVISTNSTDNSLTITVNAPKITQSVTSGVITTQLANADGIAIQGTASSVTIQGGGNNTVTSSGNVITVSGDDTVAQLKAENNGAISLYNSKNGGSATKNGSVTFAGSGDLAPNISSSANDGTVTFTVDAPNVAASFGADGSLNLGLKSSDGVEIAHTKTSVKPSILYGTNGDNEAVFESGVATLSIPTTAEIQNLLKNLDAMTFKNVLSADAVAAIDTANKGDTYKINEGGAINGTDVKAGDLAINVGNDGEAPEWSIVPAGDEVIVTYELANGSNKVFLKDTDGKDCGAITGGNMITITNGAINHDTVTANDTEPQAAVKTMSMIGSDTVSFQAYSEIGHDAYGHVTKTVYGTYVIAPIASVASTIAVTADKKSATVTTKITDADGSQNVSDSYTLTSGTIEMTSANDGTLNMDLVWGEF